MLSDLCCFLFLFLTILLLELENQKKRRKKKKEKEIILFYTLLASEIQIYSPQYQSVSDCRL